MGDNAAESQQVHAKRALVASADKVLGRLGGVALTALLLEATGLLVAVLCGNRDIRLSPWSLPLVAAGLALDTLRTALPLLSLAVVCSRRALENVPQQARGVWRLLLAFHVVALAFSTLYWVRRLDTHLGSVAALLVLVWQTTRLGYAAWQILALSELRKLQTEMLMLLRARQDK